MLNRPVSRTYEDFAIEVKKNEEVRFIEYLDELADEYKQSLLGVYEGDVLSDEYQEFHDSILKTESPIERILYVAINHLLHTQYGEYMYYITPQFEVPDSNYRVDFLVHMADPNWRINADVLVEVDGHQFHQKTKEQVARDKKRDRHLVRNFGKLITFTGSEVYANPNACAEEVMAILRRDLIKQIKNK